MEAAIRDVTDSKSESESDGIPTLFPQSVGYLKSDRNGFRLYVLVQPYDYFHK